jgi:polysaccharide export outer membrane protein
VKESRLLRALAIVVTAMLAVAARAGAEDAEPAGYTFGIGDLLDVIVWQRPDLGGQVVVDSEGNVVLPLIGTIRAAGQTPERLADELTRRFAFVDRSVSQVTVSVAAYNSRRVFVLGEVATPGAYAFPRIPGVWEVLREAGGPTPEAALTRVRVIPPEGSGSPVVVNMEQVLATGDFSTLPVLVAGTTILVPRVEALAIDGDVVYVAGSVARPGTFPMEAAKTALQAVLSAGGPTPEADLGRVHVVRPGPVRARVIEVDLRDYQYDGVLAANVDLLPGDTVTVPRNRSRLVYALARDVAQIAANVIGTVFFFIRLGEDTQTTTTTTTDGTTTTQSTGK